MKLCLQNKTKWVKIKYSDGFDDILDANGDTLNSQKVYEVWWATTNVKLRMFFKKL